MKIDVWYCPNTQKAFDVESNKLISLNMDSVHKEEDLPSPVETSDLPFINEKGLHRVSLKYAEGYGAWVLEETEYANPELEHLNGAIGPDGAEQRRSQRGQALGTRKTDMVTILRAVDSITNTFKPMDYVIASKLPITKSTIDKVEPYLDGEVEMRTPNQKLLGWVTDHAQTTAISYGRDCHVVMARVPAKDVYEATNPGEFFYDGEIKKGTVLFTINEHGFLKEPEPKSELESSRVY